MHGKPMQRRTRCPHAPSERELDAARTAATGNGDGFDA